MQAEPVVSLFSPVAMGGLALANRIVVSPMCQYVAVDGLASDWHLQHYGSLAQSGAGLLIVEGTAVEPEGRITPGDLGLWDDATEAALGKVVEVVKRRSPTMIGVQLAHAGRKGSSRVPWDGGAQLGTADGGWPVDAPSALAHAPDEATPAALDGAGIRRIVDRFAEAARRAHRLGFDAIELHGAHGYLIHQFLSPIANARDDDYGGSAEKRLRFPLEVLDAVRAAFPGPVGIKLSVSEWVDGGLDPAQSIDIARALAGRGAAWITASSGGISPAQRIPVGPGYQVPFAQGIRDAVGVPTIAVGLVTEPAQAEAIITDGQADLVALARGMLYDPRWGWHAAAALGAKVEAAPSYWRAAPHGTDIFVETSYGAR